MIVVILGRGGCGYYVLTVVVIVFSSKFSCNFCFFGWLFW